MLLTDELQIIGIEGPCLLILQVPKRPSKIKLRPFQCVMYRRCCDRQHFFKQVKEHLLECMQQLLKDELLETWTDGMVMLLSP